MKKTALLLGLLPFFISCNFEIPKKISVSTDVEYAFNFGNFSEKLSDYISVDEITDKISNNSSSDYKMSVYDYNPGSNCSVQKFLIEMPIHEIPIDVGSYLKDLNFDSEFEAQSFDTDIEAPEFENQSVSVKLNVSNMESKFSNLSYDSASFPVLNTLSNIDLPVYLNSSGEWSSINFTSGNIEICINSEDAGAAGITITGAAIYALSSGSITGEAITSWSGSKTPGETISLSLAGKSIPAIFCVRFTVLYSVTFTTATCSASIDVVNSKINYVTGVKLTQSGDFTQTLSISDSDSNFKKCEVEEGSVTVKCSKPAGLKDSNLTITKTVAIENLIEDSEWSDTDTTNYVINRSKDLSGKTISNSDVYTLNGTYNISANGATIYFEDGKFPSLTVTSSVSITRLKSVTVDFSSYKDKLSQEISVSIPSNSQSMLNYIYLEPSGIEITYKNTLPSENDIGLKIESAIFDINKTVTLENTSGNAEKTVQILGDYSSADDSTYFEKTDKNENTIVVKKISNDATFDITPTFNLPTDDDGNLVIKNVEMSKSYKISITVKPVINWYSVNLNLSSNKISSDDDNPIDTGFSFDDLFGELKKYLYGENYTDSDDTFIQYVKLSELPLYLYFSMPDLSSLNSFGVSGKLSLGDSTSGYTYLLGDEDSSAALEAKTLTLTQDEDGTVISRLSSDTASAYSNIASYFTGSNSIKVNYDLTLGGTGNGVEIKKSEMDELSDTTASISITACLEIPLQLSVGAPAADAGYSNPYVDIFKLLNTEDLFFRSGENGTSIVSFKKYTDIVEDTTLIYKFTNGFFSDNAYIDFDCSAYTDSVLVDEDDSSSGITLETKKYVLYLTNGSLNISTNDFYYWLRTPKFAPKLQIVIPKNSTIKVPRDAEFGVNLAVKIDTNGEKITLFGDDDE